MNNPNKSGSVMKSYATLAANEKVRLGVVKWFGNLQTNGAYGFITADGVDYFFHRRDCIANAEPSENAIVLFCDNSARNQEHKLAASNVCLLDDRCEEPTIDIAVNLLLSRQFEVTTATQRIPFEVFKLVIKRKGSSIDQHALERLLNLSTYDIRIRHCTELLMELTNPLISIASSAFLQTIMEIRSSSSSDSSFLQLFNEAETSVWNMLRWVKPDFPLDTKSEIGKITTFVSSCGPLDGSRHLKARLIANDALNICYADADADMIPLMSLDDQHKYCHKQLQVFTVSRDPEVLAQALRLPWNAQIIAEVRLLNWLTSTKQITLNDNLFGMLHELKQYHLSHNIFEWHIMDQATNARTARLKETIKRVCGDCSQDYIDRLRMCYQCIIMPDVSDFVTFAQAVWLEVPKGTVNFDDTTLNQIRSGLDNHRARLFIKRLFHEHCECPDKLTARYLESYQREDFSTKFLIKMIERITEHKLYMRQNEFDEQLSLFLSQYFDKYDAIPIITDYFDLCKGATRWKNGKDTDGKPTHVRDLYKKSDFINFCEGKRYMKSLENNQSEERWWCGNQYCLEPAISDKSKWQDYTLWDFMRILQVKYELDDYQKLNGYINRFLRLLEHLTCRECGKVLMPANVSGFGFYRVSHFRCTNSECACNKREEIIYLTHCLESWCQRIVDSRDSKKCPNGWFICNYCLSCCTTDKISQRVQNRREVDPFDHAQKSTGHRDDGLLYCPKCGKQMSVPSKNGVSIDQKIKEWDSWLNKGERTKALLRKDIRPGDSRPWYRYRAEILKSYPNLKNKLLASGFKCEVNENGTVFISAPFRNESMPCRCTDCDYVLSLRRADNSYDTERRKILEHAHPDIDEFMSAYTSKEQ